MPKYINVMPIRTKGAKPPLFCVHGEPLKMAFRTGVDRPIYGVCLLYNTNLGLERPDANLPASIVEMAALYLEEIRQIQPKGPYYICAYSAGGMVAFEMARQLLAAGEQIGNLTLVEPKTAQTVVAASSIDKIGRAIAYVKAADSNLRALGDIARKLKWTMGRRLAKAKEHLLSILGRKTGARLNDVQRWMLLIAYMRPLMQGYPYHTLNADVTMVYCDLTTEVHESLVAYWRNKFSGRFEFVCIKGVFTHHDLMDGAALDQTIAMLDNSVA